MNTEQLAKAKKLENEIQTQKDRLEKQEIYLKRVEQLDANKTINEDNCRMEVYISGEGSIMLPFLNALENLQLSVFRTQKYLSELQKEFDAL